MKKLRIVVFFLFGFSILLSGKGKEVEKGPVSVALDRSKIILSRRNLPINKDLLVEYNQFFKKMISSLYGFVKLVDTDLEYWKNENYVERRVPWYYKSLYRQFFKKLYQKKVALSISKLKLLKKEACTLLGLFYEYVSYFEAHQVDDAVEVLKIIESVFPMPEAETSLIFTAKIKKYCHSLQFQYKKYKAPSHVRKHWKSYSAATAAVGVALYLYSQNEEYCSKQYQIIKDTWSDYASDMASSTWNLITQGIFGEPVKIMKDHPDDESGAAYIPEVPIFTEEHFPKIPIVLNQRVWIAGMLPIGNQGNKITIDLGGLADYVNDKPRSTAVNSRRYIYDMAKEADKAFNGLQKKFGIVFCAAAMYPLYAGVNEIRKHVQKIHVFDPAAYHVRKLHQIVHSNKGLKFEQNGALYAHTRMLLDTLFKFPTDIAQIIYEDSTRLKNVQTPIEEKRQIVNRWHNTYNFLRI